MYGVIFVKTKMFGKFLVVFVFVVCSCLDISSRRSQMAQHLCGPVKMTLNEKCTGKEKHLARLWKMPCVCVSVIFENDSLSLCLCLEPCHIKRNVSSSFRHKTNFFILCFTQKQHFCSAFFPLDNIIFNSKQFCYHTITVIIRKRIG